MSFEIAKGSIEMKAIKLTDSSNNNEENQTMKIYIINNKDYKLNICAIIEGLNDNMKMENMDDVFDYEYARRKKKEDSCEKEMRFDVLIYGQWKGEDCGIDLEVMMEENLVLDSETKRNVLTLSRQLLKSIKATLKRSLEKELIFCLECGWRMNSKEMLRKHGSDVHELNEFRIELNDHRSDAFIMHFGNERMDECHLSAFRRTDWFDQLTEKNMPFLVPFIDQGRSPPSLSILPNWTTTISPDAVFCSVCDISFMNINELEEHMKIDHFREDLSRVEHTRTEHHMLDFSRMDQPRMDQPRSTSPSSRTSNRHGSNREYRCNICNYKTITKGNLHIHFQSEKHRNNQREHDQNEQKSRIHIQEPPTLPTLASMPQMHLFDSLMSRTGTFFSNIKASQFSNNWTQNNISEIKKDASLTIVPNEPNPISSFECDICHNYSHQDADVILEHAERPRPLPSNSEVSKVVRVGIEGAQSTELEHLCLLDGYKTRIKANFLLHFKTEKHQQKLQLLAHAREGGMENANKIVLQMVTEPTPLVNIRCSLCRSTFSTAHKLRLHVDSSDHQINQKISVSFRMWQKSLEEHSNVGEDNLIAGFECKPCGAIFRRFIDVLDHFQNQRNNIHMAFFKKEVDINSLVKINYFNHTDSPEVFNGLPESGPISTDEMDGSEQILFQCYLCNEDVNKKDLRNHLKEIHKIQENCVDQLIKLAAKSSSERSLDSCSKALKVARYPNDWCDCVIIKESDNFEPMVRCQQCGKCYATVALLEEHRTVVKHTEIQDLRGHLCYKKGCNQYFKSVSLMTDHFYEIHAFQIPEYNKLGPFKYICNICHLLAFSDPLKHAQHMSSHSKLNNLDCTICGMVIDSRIILRVHIEASHIIDSDKSETDWKIKGIENMECSRANNESSTNLSPNLMRGDSQSSFSSPESIINKENRNLLNHLQGCSEQLSSAKVTPPSVVESTPFLNSWSSVASLIQAVGLENVKLVIETMINSKYDQNEKDSLVWRFAESIINVANIQETLIEKCGDCGKLFSCQSVLRKHALLCTNASIECLNEFERVVSLCRDHLTRMMLSFSSEPNRKPLFISINSHPNEAQLEESLIKLSQQFRPQLSREDQIANAPVKLTTSGLLNFNRSIFQPMLNPYRFPQSNHSFLNILPPLGMFPMPQFRFTGQHSTSSLTNINMFTNKIPISTSVINNSSMDSIKLQDPLMKSDNFNRKRTQIKNYQYEILRSFFNINNPPNDETIAEIINKTGLDKKTVKHWFRNTLFKERQRCKDSPYNFSIPPETSLNFEEYEKTGKVEIKSESIRQSSPIFIIKESDEDKNEDNRKESRSGIKRSSENGSEITILSKRIKSVSSENNCKEISEGSERSFLAQTLNSDIKRSYSMTSEKSNDNKVKRESIHSQSEEIPLDLSYQSNGFNVFNRSRSSLTLDPISPFESEQEQAENSNSMCGERRHRTTLTAMQIQAMKSIFIHCRSPTHGELAALGNFLSLDMRVVQVWFQNQRAKLKKQERDMFYREKPIFPEAIPSVVDLPKCDRSHCLVCNQNLSPGVTKQSHLFSTGHLTMLMRCLLTKSHDMKLSWKSISEANQL